jgi:hypothetical protein
MGHAFLLEQLAVSSPFTERSLYFAEEFLVWSDYWLAGYRS